MSSGSNVLKLDRDSIAAFQKEMYNGDASDPNVGTRFTLDFEKRSQASHMKEKLEQIPAKEGKVVYTASKKFDYLFKMSAHTTLAPIKVKEKYQNTVSICYIKNLGHNILPLGECEIDDEHIAYTDSIYHDCYSQHYVTKRQLYNQMIGNVDCLTKWNTELPKYPIVAPQHFSFFRKTQTCLPILKSSSNKIIFRYNVLTKLTDLIRMRILYQGEYREIKCNLKYLEYESPSIPIPEMWGRYAEITDPERNWRKSIDEKTGQHLKQTIYIEDIDITSSKNPRTIGTVDVIPLQSEKPAKHIFWVASLVGGNLSNYTTDKDDVDKGWNPCEKSQIKYAGSDRVEELSHEHFDVSECYDFDWPTHPNEAGYNVYTYTFNPVDYSHADTAVILKDCGASLNITLGDTNPFIVPEEEEERTDEDGNAIPVEINDFDETENSKKDKYIIHVRTVVLRKMQVSWEDKNGKLKYEFV